MSLLALDNKLSLRDLLFILTLHWIADFVFQTEYMSQSKSKSWKALFIHTFTYSYTWLIPAMLMHHYYFPYNWLLSFYTAIVFVNITLLFHTVTDAVTSRITTKYYILKKFKAFFTTIGFDQVLHYIQLGLTYLFIIKWNMLNGSIMFLL